MAEGYNYLEGTQTDINRRLLRKILELENGTAELEGKLTTAEETIQDHEERIEALEDEG